MAGQYELESTISIAGVLICRVLLCGTSLQFKNREEREQTFDLKIADTLFGCFTTNDARNND